MRRFKIYKRPGGAERTVNMKNSVNSEAIRQLLRSAGNESLFCNIFDSFPYPLQIYRPDGLLIAINPAFLRELGIPDAGMIVEKYNILQDTTLVRLGVLGKIRAAFEGRHESVTGFPAPVHRLKKWLNIPVESVELFYLDISFFPLKNDSGDMIGVVFVYITRNKLTDREEIVKAKEYIESNWYEKFNVEDVARAVMMSVAHFERVFKTYTGMTPNAYYLRTKVNKLKEALLNLNLSIEQAFSACGLTYHGHYAKLFKRETGLTPTEYRKLVRSHAMHNDITESPAG